MKNLPKHVSVDRLREIAGYWHGGQFSALYAFCSSGGVNPGLRGESILAASQALALGNRRDARALLHIAKLEEPTNE